MHCTILEHPQPPPPPQKKIHTKKKIMFVSTKKTRNQYISTKSIVSLILFG